MDECYGCCLTDLECLMHKYQREKDCPCRICLFKTLCTTSNQLCLDYKDLVDDINKSRTK